MGVVALPLSLPIFSAKPVTPSKSAPKHLDDPRIGRLRAFLSRLHCPVANISEDFVRAADDNHLDWRLLPSIAVVESGGGKTAKNNNIFGWKNGVQRFATVRSGLELVAYKLGRSPLYRKLDSVGKLRVYNESGEYADAVLSVMNRIGPPLEAQSSYAFVHN